MFNSAIKTNAETFKKYIINAFSYTLKDITLDWCYNYMSKFPYCIFEAYTSILQMSLED